MPADSSTLDILRLAGVVIAAVGGGVMNSIAGGGTLLTFPALIALGVPPLVANATSTVALWPGGVASMYGYRDRLRGTRKWATTFAIPSVTGGACGALLLLATPADRFEVIVPWLVLGATVLFAVQAPFMRYVRGHFGNPQRASAGVSVDQGAPPAHSATGLLCQFGIAVYGGYFGAGMGILILAVLGFMGFTDIHRMNGLKNWSGMWLNLMAAGLFVWSGIVNWPVAIAMAAGATAGGYLASRIAQRVPQVVIRRAVLVIGFASALWLFR